MGEMTVVVLRIIDIVEPFLQLSPAAHLHGRQLRQLFADGLQQRVLVIQHLGRLQHLGEQFGDNLVVHRHTGIERRTTPLASVFGRLSRTNDQITQSGVFHQGLRIETGGLEHDGIGLTQEFLVARVQIMLPQVAANPAAARRPQSGGGMINGSGDAPLVGVVV